MFDPGPLPRDLRAFYDLWDSKRAGRLFPARTDLQFQELRPWLESLHVVEVLPDDFLYKIFATKSAERLGHELTGKLLSQIKPRQLAEDAVIDYRRCAATKEPNFADRTERYVDNRLFSWKRLIVPLGANAIDVDHLMVCIEYHLI